MDPSDALVYLGICESTSMACEFHKTEEPFNFSPK